MAASLLTKTRVRAKLLSTKLRPFIDAILAHCSVTSRLAGRLGLGPEIQVALKHSFAQWNGKGIPEGFGGVQISIAVRIGALADLVEVAFRDRGIDGAIDIAHTWSGISLDPSLVDAWNGLAPSILRAVDGDAARDIVIEAAPNLPVAREDVNAAFDLLADYADVKSPWFLAFARGG